MRILISNDDGVAAPGLAALHAALADYAECTVIAPDQDKSGASSSLTLDRPLHPVRQDQLAPGDFPGAGRPGSRAGD